MQTKFVNNKKYYPNTESVALDNECIETNEAIVQNINSNLKSIFGYLCNNDQLCINITKLKFTIIVGKNRIVGRKLSMQ